MAVLHPNDKILIIDRRSFRDDLTNVFLGVIEEYEEGTIRTRGFAYHINPYEIGTEKRAEERVRVLALSCGAVIYMLPRELDLGEIEIKRSPKTLVLTDGHSLSMDLTDFMSRT